tara:strand:- start:56 stop:484 length:429 start_codon:yes stop_codon:yes gene_type:complete
MKKILVWLVIMLVVLGAGTITFLYYGSYSTGVRAGTIIKLSKKGVVFKTWEGQLSVNTFGAVKSDNQLSEIFEFSVQKGQDSIYNVLQRASLSGERINLHYIERYAVLPWRGSTKYFVESVELSGKKEEESSAKNKLYKENQ